MSAPGGKGDNQRPESKPGNFSRGYDGIAWGSGICPVCRELRVKCECYPTEDGPGQDGEDKEKRE